MRNREIIVLSGSHRSGSTWTGKMIALSPRVYYVGEPFNPGAKHLGSPVNTRFLDPTFIKNTKQQQILDYLNKVLYNPIYYFAYNMYYNIARKRKVFVKYFYSYMSNLANNQKKTFSKANCPVLKDPTALFALEWIENNFNSKTVVLIRHPAAFVASTKIANWDFVVEEFLEQPRLVENYFSDYESEIYDFARNKKTLIENNALGWKLLHKRILQYREIHKNWYFVKHEDLSIHPIREFEKMYQFLDIPFNEKVISRIHEFTKSRRNTYYRRDSRKNIHSWKERLTMQEIEYVRNSTKDIWPEFYSNNDW